MTTIILSNQITNVQLFLSQNPHTHYGATRILINSSGRATHMCVGNLSIIGSDDGLSPGRRQAIIWSNAGILLNEPLGKNFSEISIAIHTFSSKKFYLKMLSAKWRLFRLGLNVSMFNGQYSFATPLSRYMFRHFIRKWKDHVSHMSIKYLV